MSETVLVTGGTGTLGRLVTPLLVEEGYDVRVLSRGRREPEPGRAYVVGDLVGNEGLEEALAGVHTVVHLAGGQRGDDTAAANLGAAGNRTGLEKLVYISVIGQAPYRCAGSG